MKPNAVTIETIDTTNIIVRAPYNPRFNTAAVNLAGR